MEINKIFKIARESQNINQTIISEAAEITQTAISKFENGNSTLSEKTLKKIAPLLNINPDFVSGKSLNPFKSSSLVKLFVGLGGLYFFLNLFLEYNRKLDFLSIAPRFSGMEKLTKQFGIRLLVSIVGKKISSAAGTFIYAVAVRDASNNYFLIRNFNNKGFLLWEGEDENIEWYVNKILYKNKFFEETRGHGDRSYTFNRLEINRPFYEKIRDWNIKRKDIEPLFRSKSKEPLTLTETEKKLILSVREKSIDPHILIQHIKKT